MNHHIFGPVASRRLGRSLGIDLLSFKTCTYNCVYCECGATTNLTILREEFFPPEEIIAELDRVLSKRPELDYITFAGSGEPTLFLSIGQIYPLSEREISRISCCRAYQRKSHYDN